jgi:hypothetical protein
MDASEPTEIVDRLGWMARKLKKDLISHDAPARHIPAASFHFSPDGHFTKHRSPFRLECVPPPDSLIPFLWLSTFSPHHRFESCKFLVHPLRTTECVQAIL